MSLYTHYFIVTPKDVFGLVLEYLFSEYTNFLLVYVLFFNRNKT